MADSSLWYVVSSMGTLAENIWKLGCHNKWSCSWDADKPEFWESDSNPQNDMQSFRQLLLKLSATGQPIEKPPWPISLVNLSWMPLKDSIQGIGYGANRVTSWKCQMLTSATNASQLLLLLLGKGHSTHLSRVPHPCSSSHQRAPRCPRKQHAHLALWAATIGRLPSPKCICKDCDFLKMGAGWLIRGSSVGPSCFLMDFTQPHVIVCGFSHQGKDGNHLFTKWSHWVAFISFAFFFPASKFAPALFTRCCSYKCL